MEFLFVAVHTSYVWSKWSSVNSGSCLSVVTKMPRSLMMDIYTLDISYRARFSSLISSFCSVFHGHFSLLSS
jgi:hypothetical protein